MKSLSSVLCLFLLLGVSCSENDNGESGRHPGADKVEVVLPIADSFGETANYSAENSSENDMPITRTLILGDGGLDKVGWAETDEVSLWAAAEGTADYVLDGETFTYYTPIQGNALFTATIPQMAAGTYNYYGAYPVPNSISGTQVTYTLAAEQSGVYDGTQDIMLAHPTSGSELTENTPASAARLSFAHKCHVLRIQVPTGRNKWGIGVKKLRIKFPAEVVGDLQFDVTNPDAEPVFTNGSNTVTLNLVRPLDESEEDASDGNYVWVFLRPGVQLTGNLEFTAYSGEGYQSETISTHISKTLAEGRITPVTMTIPKELPVTYYDLSIGTNNLGEAPTKFTITAPDGVLLRNGTNKQSFTANPENKYELAFYHTYDGIQNGELLRTGTTAFQYESESAVTSGTQVLTAAITEGTHNACSLTVPYLYQENFDAVTTFHNDDDNTTSRTSGGSNTAVNLPSIGGWTGARCGSEAGKALRVCCRAERAALVPGTYNGRADSPTMSNIKEGKTLKLRIQFKYSMNRQSSKSSANQHYLAFGSHTTSGPIDAQSGVGTPWGDPMLGYKIPESAVIAKDINSPNDGSFDYIYKDADYTVANCTQANRFVWEVYIKSKSPDGYYNNWLYIDDIKVQIVQ